MAVKVIPVTAGSDATQHRRIITEARVLARLDHPHVVRLLEYCETNGETDGETDGLCLLVMERLTGGTLRQRVVRGQVAVEVACAVGLAVATALDYSHRHSILHRDIKPANILFAADDTLKVADFGIAKIAENSVYLGGTLAGTPRYMAPEQIVGAPPGPGTDVYALGIVLHELFTGTPPPAHPRDPGEIYRRRRRERPLPALNTVAPELAAVVARAVRTRRADRHASAHALALELATAAARVLGPGWLRRCGLPLFLDEETREAATGGLPLAVPDAGGRLGRHGRHSRREPPPLAVTTAPDDDTNTDHADTATRPQPRPVPLPPPGFPPGPPTGKPTDLPRRPQDPTSQLDYPHALVVSPSGLLLVARPARNIVSVITPDGGIGTVAGSGKAGRSGDNGRAVDADLDNPNGLALGGDGSLYIADTFSDRIRRVTPDGNISTVVTLTRPRGVAAAPDGTLVVADTDGHRVVRVSVTGSVTPVAGTGYPGFSGDDGPGKDAELRRPCAVAVDAGGAVLIADTDNRRVRRVTPDGLITTVVGTFLGTAAGGVRATETVIGRPHGLVLDAAGCLFVADPDNHRVWAVRSDGSIAATAGTGRAGAAGDRGPSAKADLNRPHGVAFGPDRSLYIADTGNHRIRMVSPSGTISTISTISTVGMRGGGRRGGGRRGGGK